MFYWYWLKLNITIYSIYFNKQSLLNGCSLKLYWLNRFENYMLFKWYYFAVSFLKYFYILNLETILYYYYLIVCIRYSILYTCMTMVNI